MEIIKCTIDYPSRSEHFNIIPLGDIHIGNIGCDIPKLKEEIDYIKGKKNTYWLGMGDYIEAIQIDDPRFDELSIDPFYKIRDISQLITQQMQDIVRLFSPIRHKCLGLLSGNHEETVRLKYKRYIMYEIAERLGLIDKLLGYDGWIQLTFRREKPKAKLSFTTYNIYATHGFGAARKSGAKINRLEDVAHFMDAEIICLAHEHKKIIAPPLLRLGLSQQATLIQKKQLAVMTGSFLKGYIQHGQTYVEKKGYAPADLGVVKIILKPDIKDIHASL